MRVVLISTYDLGRQPFGLASPAAWLREAGFEVACADLAVSELDESSVAAAGLVAFHLPMHTATRLAAGVVPRVREINPEAHLCFYGLYAPLNEDWLRSLGAGTILGGEFEDALVRLAARLGGATNGDNGDRVPPADDSIPRQRFRVPDRAGLPPLDRYAHVHLGDGTKRTVGYTEASRGCRHLCRHCPVVPIYGGSLRAVQREVVLEDIRRQVGAGAGHITFGDPDFFNGVAHGMSIVEEMHREHPALTYDVTVKVGHLVQHHERLEDLARTGCLFVTSAVESLDDEVLRRLDKGHTRDDFVTVVHACREAGVELNPTFVAFHPWLSLEDYRELLATLVDLDLVDRVASIQLALRLLLPRGSRLVELPDVRRLVGEFDADGLVYPWEHPDPRVDELHREVTAIVVGARGERDRRDVFARIWDAASDALGGSEPSNLAGDWRRQRVAVPYLTEPWYC